ncbi:hypothetical protein QYE76_028997 [Lolium multiflorum]|uniref:Serine/threonine-protein kinase BSK1-like TPR repeats domain-containing protein n=1 Tax=Lolium multiflorum TaxID=4521 RepID=A0AAD8QQA9_LOLMU|nr:hypothetical protein QYE76_028997 [Lolium multiflorum]
MAAELKSGTGPGAAGVWASCGQSALHLAAANGRLPICRYLVQDLGFPVDAPDSHCETPLVLAATHGHTKTAAYLLKRGADPHAKDSHGETVLHWAASNGDLELARLLLKKGADPGATNARGTPLHNAAARAHPEVVALLLKRGADPNNVVNSVFTPLIASIVSSSLECMKLLIEAKANVNTGGFSGTTPLFIACNLSDAVPFVKCLLDAGANANATDELGRLPIEVAAADAEMELIEVLFPVTRRQPTMLDWSVAGIVRHVNSAAYKEWVIQASCIKKDEMKQQGHSAFKRKDYDEAILFYNLALKFDCTDATLYSNRSLCWLRLGVGEEALSDAQECTRIRPDWAKGYYRQGMAFCLIQDPVSAYRAFLKASKLDPGNTDIRNAIRVVPLGSAPEGPELPLGLLGHLASCTLEAAVVNGNVGGKCESEQIQLGATTEVPGKGSSKNHRGRMATVVHFHDNLEPEHYPRIFKPTFRQLAIPSKFVKWFRPIPSNIIVRSNTGCSWRMTMKKVGTKHSSSRGGQPSLSPNN